MTTKHYTMTITESDEAKCKAAMQAASDIVKSLSHDDLIGLAKLIMDNPGIVQMAKQNAHLFSKN